MPHLSRLLAAICAIAVILVSLPTNAGPGDKDLQPLSGEKAKLLYTVVGVANTAAVATAFHCTSTERTNGRTIRLGIEVFNPTGTLENDVTVGVGELQVAAGRTTSVSTTDTAVFREDEYLNTGTVSQGFARIFATSKNVLCSVMIVDSVNNPPTSMVMLPVFKATKQGGM